MKAQTLWLQMTLNGVEIAKQRMDYTGLDNATATMHYQQRIAYEMCLQHERAIIGAGVPPVFFVQVPSKMNHPDFVAEETEAYTKAA